MSVFVLVHGSWHDGSSWAEVAEHLEELGHEMHSPTVAGHGAGAPREVTHDDCVASITDYVDRHDLAGFVLVGHSWGGSVIARVVERLPDRVRRLVFLNAFVPRERDERAGQRSARLPGAVPDPGRAVERQHGDAAVRGLARRVHRRRRPGPGPGDLRDAHPGTARSDGGEAGPHEVLRVDRRSPQLCPVRRGLGSSAGRPRARLPGQRPSARHVPAGDARRFARGHVHRPGSAGAQARARGSRLIRFDGLSPRPRGPGPADAATFPPGRRVGWKNEKLQGEGRSRAGFPGAGTGRRSAGDEGPAAVAAAAAARVVRRTVRRARDRRTRATAPG
ncbi:alpha/beta hydrolase family protein [Amycolatopsis sp. NPDC051373]|uniref:alpha/beta hydrolase family protein n=1 Tax=Amycolatopsis sp. NPDC051373 TaxID=3155801 RepID=UPI00344ED68F